MNVLWTVSVCQFALIQLATETITEAYTVVNIPDTGSATLIDAKDGCTA